MSEQAQAAEESAPTETPTNEADSSLQGKPEPSTPQVVEARLSEDERKAIIEQARKESASEAESKLDAIAKALTGKKDEPDPNPIHKAFAQTPEEFLRAQNEAIRENILKELKEEKIKESELRGGMDQGLSDYPELRDHIEYVDVLAAQEYQKNPNMSRREAIMAGFKKAAEKLDIKPMSEREREQQLGNAFFPTSAGRGGESGESQADSQKDYVKALQSHHRKYALRKED